MQRVSWRQAVWFGLALCLVCTLVRVEWKGRNVTMARANRAQAGKWLRGTVIVVDPGHGGPDPGAVVEGTEEKGLVLEIGLILKRLLEHQGASVILTRDTDRSLGGPMREELTKRIALVEQHKAMVFVSIHANKDQCLCWGAQTFFQKGGLPAGKELALAIQHQLRNLTPTTRVSLPANYFVLRTSPAPAAMVEVGFLSYGPEKARLKDPAYQQTVATAVLLGIADFFHAQTPDARAGGSVGR